MKKMNQCPLQETILLVAVTDGFYPHFDVSHLKLTPLSKTVPIYYCNNSVQLYAHFLMHLLLILIPSV